MRSIPISGYISILLQYPRVHDGDGDCAVIDLTLNVFLCFNSRISRRLSASRLADNFIFSGDDIRKDGIVYDQKKYQPRIMMLVLLSLTALDWHRAKVAAFVSRCS